MTRPNQGRGKKSPNSTLDPMVMEPGDGKIAESFLYKDRPVALVTVDGRALTKYRAGQLKPVNEDVWFSYFKPPVYIRAKKR